MNTLELRIGRRTSRAARGRLLAILGIALGAATLAATATAARSTIFDYDRSAPLAVRHGQTTTSAGAVREELSYRVDSSLRLKAMFVHPAAGGPWPLVIWSPGAGGDRKQQLPDAVALARAGGASLLIDTPESRTRCNADENLRIFTSYVISRRRAIDLAETLPNVDPKRIGAAGFSYGASVTATLSGVEPRLVAVALKSGRAHFTGYAPVFCSSLGAQGLDEFVARVGVIDPVHWVSASSSALLMQNGTHDDLSPAADVKALYAAARKPKELRWYPAGHDLNHEAASYRQRWLLERLTGR
jgi:dienelactone hydrolase